MSYLAIYRRFRPTDFSDVVGQEHVVTTLINQIKTERIGHAYLFCGARGTGKTTVARIFARAINCLTPNDGSPCGHCEVCEKLNNPSNLDILEIDAASNNKVDNVQEIRANVQYPPVAGKYKVYIIDEVHMLTTEAFNALLKTLEEPPKHAVFILATTEPHKLPATILSRCMRFDFHLVADKVIENLIEKIYDEVGKSYEKEATALIAKFGEGSIRDALSLADLCISYSDQKLTYKQVIDILGASDSTKTADLLTGILNSDVGKVLSVIEELTGLGKSISVLTKDVLSMVRDVLVVKTCKGAKEILMLPDREYDKLIELSDSADNHRFLRILEIFTAIETDLRYSTHPRIVFEAAAVKATLPSADYNNDALISRISALEKTVESLLKNGVKLAKAETFADVPENAVETQKSAYKPIIEQNVADKAEKTEKTSEAQKPAYKPDNGQIATIPKFESSPEAPVNSERLSGFDYEPDEPPAIEESYAPPENQIGFDGFDNFYTSPATEASRVKKAEIDEALSAKTSPATSQTPPTTATATSGEVIRDRISDARLWGTVIRKLRSDKHIMLWIACQELDAEVKNNQLVITAEGENEYNLLIKKESMETLQSIVSSLAPYTVTVQRSDSGDSSEQFSEDAKKVKEMFGGDIKIEN